MIATIKELRERYGRKQYMTIITKHMLVGDGWGVTGAIADIRRQHPHIGKKPYAWLRADLYGDDTRVFVILRKSPEDVEKGDITDILLRAEKEAEEAGDDGLAFSARVLRKGVKLW